MSSLDEVLYKQAHVVRKDVRKISVTHNMHVETDLKRSGAAGKKHRLH